MKTFHLLSALVFFALLTSCTKEKSLSNESPSIQTPAVANTKQEEHVNIFKGPEVQVGNGKVRSWIKIDHKDQPVEMGIEFTNDALTRLPDHVHEGEAHPHWDIPLHQKAKKVTPFDHIEINWNLQGHPPAGLFDVPHFDAHFYMMTAAERLSRLPGDPKMEILPPANEWPAGYFPSADAIPFMGKHWIAPPLNPPFSKVLIWGSYNGKMTFIEPMVKVACLQSGAASSQLFGQPTVYPKPGTYPMQYNVFKDDKGNHQITLSDFIAR